MIKFQGANRVNFCARTRNRQHSGKSQAFTLVELIISMLIFTIFIGVVASTFLLVSRSLREANEVRKVYTEARAIMDQLTQDVRLNTLDYNCYGDAADGSFDYGSSFGECSVGLGDTGSASLLALISADGLHRTVYRFGPGANGEGVFSVLKLDWNENGIGGGEWVTAEGFSSSAGFLAFGNESVVLQNVGFVIAPLASPVSLENAHQFQPSVHVVIEARSTSSRLPESIPVSLTTTISSRVYSFF